MRISRLVTIKIERRSVAAAVFFGERIDHTQVRQLSSAQQQAETSTMAFVNWLVRTFEIGCAGLEFDVTDRGSRYRLLTDAATKTFRQFGIPIWEVRKRELLSSFGVPELRNRKQLRNVIRSIWPILQVPEKHGSILDAAALGLYVSTERLFTANQS